MICESCKQEEATILLTKISADNKRALHLCPSCATKAAHSNQSEEVALAAPEKVPEQEPPAAKSPNPVAGHLPKTEKVSDKPCSGCGMTYRQFRKNGRLGCVDCYDAFAAELRRLMKRIHGAQTHTGKRPAEPSQVVTDAPIAAAIEPEVAVKEDDLHQLRADLERAVRDEAYEQAAALRDQIGQLEARAIEHGDSK
jgi:protein arginine kinase activator